LQVSPGIRKQHKNRSFDQKLPVFTYADIFLALPAKAWHGVFVEISTNTGRCEKCKNGNERGRSLFAIQVMALAERERSSRATTCSASECPPTRHSSQTCV